MLNREALKATGWAAKRWLHNNVEPEPELESMRKGFKALLDQSSHLVWLLSLEGTVLEVNDAALALGGLEEREAMGQPLAQGSAWGFMGYGQQQLQRAIAAAANGQTIHCKVKTKPGDRGGKKLQLTVRPVGEKAGQPMLLIVEGTNEIDRQQLESSLLRCQRLKSASEQTLEMINDFKNLLAPLSAIATLLHLEFPEADRSQRELFQIIATSTHRANAVIQQMLTYVQGDQAHYTTLEADRLRLDIQSLLEPTFPESISLQMSFSPALWLAEINENQIHQVLMNLCWNARDAMPQGGQIKISAENFTPENFTENSFAPDSFTPDSLMQDGLTPEMISADLASTDPASADYIVIRVSDTGNGIPAEHLNKIFNPFFTTKPTGDGLGLATAMDIINSHGGFIEVTSVEEIGTEFRVFLPAKRPESAIPSVKPISRHI